MSSLDPAKHLWANPGFPRNLRLGKPKLFSHILEVTTDRHIGIVDSAEHDPGIHGFGYFTPNCIICQYLVGDLFRLPCRKTVPPGQAPR